MNAAKDLTYQDVRDIANSNNLGQVHFEQRVAVNTGKHFEAGYVFVNHYKELFCKQRSGTDVFYLCNDFRSLA